MKRRRNGRRGRKKRRRSVVGSDGVLPKSERLDPVEFVARMILTMQSAPRQRVVDVAFDTVCRMHGFIPMKVLTFLVDEGLAFVDDSHKSHKVIGLTTSGAAAGGFQRMN